MAGTELVSLVDELEQICLHRPTREVEFERRITIEQRLIELLTEEEGQSHEQQRQSVRLPCKLAVHISTDADSRPGMVMDIGHGGVYVCTNLSATVGDVVEIETASPMDAPSTPFTVRGRVVWAGKKAGQKGPCDGYGVRLDAPDAHTDQNLWRFLIGLMRNLQSSL